LLHGINRLQDHQELSVLKYKKILKQLKRLNVKYVVQQRVGPRIELTMRYSTVKN